MDHHISDYFCQSCDDAPRGNFHRVIPLHQSPDMTWEEASKKAPTLCRGWYELSRLNTEDRIEFTRDFWLAKLPYHPRLSEFMVKFFDELDEIGIYLTQKTFDDPLEATLVYSLKNDSGFFRGGPPANEELLAKLQQAFQNFIFPSDYLAFLKIHNGFWKTTDVTGLKPSWRMWECYRNFQDMLEQEEELTTGKGIPVDPQTLIPFYESFGMPFYQCFWSEWYPEQETGNVYYSGLTKTISDVNSPDPSSDGMAFPTFLDWLMFYLERIE